MKVLLVAVEVAPIIKLGGLGDVIGSLPKALEKLGVDADVIAPYFPSAKTQGLAIYKSFDMEVPYGGKTELVKVYKTKIPNSDVDVILLKNPAHFSRHSSTWVPLNETELESFSFFDRAVVEYIKSSFNIYDLIHCNDWHTGLVTHILEEEIPETRPATLFTIHNLMYQGIGDPEVVRNVGIIPGTHPTIDWDVADGDVNMIQQGVTSSDFISAVSPTYAKEIMTPEYGGGLDELLKAREGRVTGILNGVDYSAFPRSYDLTNYSAKKTEIKTKLFEKLGLTLGGDGSKVEEDGSKIPLFSFVGRLDPYQKGLDILYEAIPYIIKKGGRVVLLGDGDATWKSRFLELAERTDCKGKFSAQLMFNTELGVQVYSGSDFLIVPSKYEPCGLIQMIAMWYGTLPIVRATGGLKDSVNEGKNGFLFEKYSAVDLTNAVGKALSLYFGQGTDEMVKCAMTTDFSWDKSAQLYKDLYQKIVQLRLS